MVSDTGESGDRLELKLMALSANTLFHFTRTLDSLLNILRSKFYPRACYEQAVISDILNFRLAIPMVCFCDIPLSQIAEHVEKYGKYAIGIKKDWAIEKGVTPVLYVHKNSVIPKAIVSEIRGIRPLGEDFSEEQMKHLMDLIRPIMVMKPYEGFDEKLRKHIRYYDEREWRYIPPSEYPKVPDFLIEKIANDSTLKSFNKAKEAYGVEFKPDVINYIIVNKEEEILSLKREISSIKGHYSYDAVELLTTRIISMERIQQDL